MTYEIKPTDSLELKAMKTEHTKLTNNLITVVDRLNQVKEKIREYEGGL